MSATQDEHHDDGHGHGHSPWIQHHYDDAKHQFDAGKLGIWLFLAQEVLFFSALFVAYILYRHHHPEIYGYAHKYLDVKFGAINTAVLIFSSLTAAWAVRAAQKRQKRLLVACLAATLLCALTFLGIKYVEYTHKVHERLLFGRYFDPCIAADGSALVNRGNECPGSKASVLWDHKKETPELGCIPALAIDQKPLTPGVQADCTNVREVPMTVVKKKDQEVVDPDTKTHVFAADDKLAVPIKKMCKPGEHGQHGGEPCWRTSYQPQVCRPGWFYTMRCTGGSGLANAERDLAAAKLVADDADKLLGIAQKAAEAVAAGAACGADTECKGGGCFKKPAKAEAEPAKPGEKDGRCIAKEVNDPLKKAGDAATEAETKLKAADALARLAAKCSEPDKFSVSPPHVDAGECKDGGRNRTKAIGKIRKGELDAKCPGPDSDDKKKCLAEHEKDPDLTMATVAECLRSEQVALVVEHHNHDAPHASNIVVAGSCKAPPKATEPDWFSDKKQTLTLGAKAATAEVVLDDHDAKYAGPPPEHTGMFFTIYFAMTGLHGIHVLLGVFVFIWLLIRASKGHFSPEYFGPVDWAALYWHIVDLIWIFLFPLMYLIH